MPSQKIPIRPAWTLQPIGTVHSVFQEKFGTPRQSGLTTLESTIELLPPFNSPEAVAELDGFSHIWVIFVFHATAARGWRPTVRPPRLGGNKRVGVFASRSTHRPNPLGLSVVELKRIDTTEGVCLTVAGSDWMDGTPVLDIKPYLPFVDAILGARSGYVDAPPLAIPVCFSAQAEESLAGMLATHPQLANTLTQALQYASPPAYQDDARRIYGVRIADCNVQFLQSQTEVNILSIHPSVSD